MIVGPKDPTTTTGEVEIIRKDETGFILRTQKYEDGTVYMAAIPRLI